MPRTHVHHYGRGCIWAQKINSDVLPRCLWLTMQHLRTDQTITSSGTTSCWSTYSQLLDLEHEKTQCEGETGELMQDVSWKEDWDIVPGWGGGQAASTWQWSCVQGQVHQWFSLFGVEELCDLSAQAPDPTHPAPLGQWKANCELTIHTVLYPTGFSQSPIW